MSDLLDIALEALRQIATIDTTSKQALILQNIAKEALIKIGKK